MTPLGDLTRSFHFNLILRKFIKPDYGLYNLLINLNKGVMACKIISLQSSVNTVFKPRRAKHKTLINASVREISQLAAS